MKKATIFFILSFYVVSFFSYGQRTIINPSIKSQSIQAFGEFKITKVQINDNNTVVDMMLTLKKDNGVYMSQPGTSTSWKIKIDEKIYKILTLNGIGDINSPTYLTANIPIYITATFEPIPVETTSFDLITNKDDPLDSGLFYINGINLNESAESTRSRQILHEDFNDNQMGWKNINIQAGRLITRNEPTELKSDLLFSEDFILKTSVNISLAGDLMFRFGNLSFAFNNTCVDNESRVQLNVSNFKRYTSSLRNRCEAFDIAIKKVDQSYYFYFNGILIYTGNGDDLKPGNISFEGSYGQSNCNIFRTTSVDYLYIDELLISPEDRQKRQDRAETEFYKKAVSSKKYDGYLSTYPNGKYHSEVLTLKEETLKDKMLTGFIDECDSYINNFPTGKYINQAKSLKAERIMYKTALNGGIKEYNTYLQTYPAGHYTSEISSLKSNKLYEIDRENKIKYNSNKALWKIGNKLCLESSSGTICGTLLGWNEDKSMFQFKVISGPDTRIEGEQIKPDAIIWITPNTNWHICVPDEIETSISQNEDPYKYWKLGKKICLKGTKGAWIFTYDVTIVGEIIQWNEDKSKVRIRIIDGADGTLYNNETLYNDKVIWDSPNGWKICQ